MHCSTKGPRHAAPTSSKVAQAHTVHGFDVHVAGRLTWLLAATLLASATPLWGADPSTGFAASPPPPSFVDDSCPDGGVLLGVGSVGLALGAVPSVTGIRVNLRDRCLGQVNGLNLTLLPPPRIDEGPFPTGSVRGMALGAAPVAATLDGVVLGGLAVVAGDRLTGVGLGGLAVVSGGVMQGAHLGGLAVVSENAMRGAQLGGLAVVSEGSIQGVQLGGLAVVSEASLRGIQAAGLAVVAESGIQGVQVGGLAVVSGGSIRGVQVAGIALSGGDVVEGIQVAGVALAARQRLSGIKVAGVTVSAPEMNGIALSGINRFEIQRGIAVGVYNRTDRLQGVQIGVLNRANANPAPFRLLPILNAGW